MIAKINAKIIPNWFIIKLTKCIKDRIVVNLHSVWALVSGRWPSSERQTLRGSTALSQSGLAYYHRSFSYQGVCGCHAMTWTSLEGVSCLVHLLGLLFPDLVLPPVICYLDIPQHRVVHDELQHQLLLFDSEVAGVFLGPFLLLLPLVISQVGGGGDISWWHRWFTGAFARKS